MGPDAGGPLLSVLSWQSSTGFPKATSEPKYLSFPTQTLAQRQSPVQLTESSVASGSLHRLFLLPRMLVAPEPVLADPSCFGGHSSMVTSSQRPLPFPSLPLLFSFFF